jgi:hypothetical protein
MDLNAQITPLGVWLLFLDSFVPGTVPEPPIALAAGARIGVGPVAAGTQRTGVAAPSVEQLIWQQIQPHIPEALRSLRAMTLLETSTIGVEIDRNPVHEGHGHQLGAPTTITAIVKPCGATSAFSGRCVLPANPVLSGINVTWQFGPELDAHGIATTTSGSTVATDGGGRTLFTFTPQEEESNGQGSEQSVKVSIQATVSKLEIAQKIYQLQLPLGVLLGKSVNTSSAAELTIEWHEEASVPVKIIWTDVYDNVPDTITFEGTLDTIDRINCPPGLTCLTGTGTASGSRAGWKGCNPGIDHIPEGEGPASFFGTIDGDRIAIGAFADITNPMAGVITGVFDVELSGGTVTLDPTPVVGELCPRYSYGTLILKQIDAPLP